MEGEEGQEKESKRIKVSYVHTPIPREEFNHDALKTY